MNKLTIFVNSLIILGYVLLLSATIYFTFWTDTFNTGDVANDRYALIASWIVSLGGGIAMCRWFFIEYHTYDV